MSAPAGKGAPTVSSVSCLSEPVIGDLTMTTNGTSLLSDSKNLSMFVDDTTWQINPRQRGDRPLHGVGQRHLERKALGSQPSLWECVGFSDSGGTHSVV